MTARLAISAAVAVAVAVLALAVTGRRDGDTRVPAVLRPELERDAGWADPGRRAFAAMGCGSCHRLAAAGSTGTIGPDLDEALAGHDRESLVHSIVEAPGQDLASMPDDYGERMTATELDDLVSFLLDSR